MLTDAYNLPAKKVIHIVGPIVQSGLTPALEKQLADYENLKERASRADALQREIEGLSQKHANEIDILKREHAAELREAIATEREKYAEQLATKFFGKFSG